jgi:hypothetical protein
LFEVDKGMATALRAMLDRLFSERLQTLSYNEAYDLEFVLHPERYFILHNSNQMVGRWLAELGCELR